MSDANQVTVTAVAPSRRGEELALGRQVGAGGMGVVREAFDPALNRTLAVKLLKPTTPERPRRRARFLAEAQVTAQLDHPHIVPVHELGEHPEHGLYIAMKLVPGETLTEAVARFPLASRSPRNLFALIQVYLKVCDAVAFAHSRGVLHRDLKPDNVMVASHGRVYLMDWGVARAAGSELDAEPVAGEQTLVGTPRYMAPEQALGDPTTVDERTDVFALGGILYEILTGQPPYPSLPIRPLLLKVAAADIPPPETVVDTPLPPRLCAIAMKALACERDERYQSVTALAQDVELFLQSGWQFPMTSYPAGAVIVREGTPGGSAYVIMAGRCRAFRGSAADPVELREMGRGEVFGETAVFSDRPRSATVVAVEPTTVMVVSREHFAEELGLGYWLGLFARALAERFLEKDQRVAELEHELGRR